MNDDLKLFLNHLAGQLEKLIALNTKSNRLDAYLKIQEIMDSVKTEIVYQQRDNIEDELRKPYAEWIHNACIAYQRAAFLCANRLVDSDLALDQWGRTFWEQWCILEPYIRNYRKEHNEPERIENGAYQMKDFEIIAVSSREYLRKRYPAVFEKMLAPRNEKQYKSSLNWIKERRKLPTI